MQPLPFAQFSERDDAFMRQALALAARAVGLSEPNPRVGCVLAAPDGTMLGAGHTQAAGQAHAEVMALRDARAAGRNLRNATAYVTLEPCSHFGRTPPCANALVEAGVERVVVAVEDPNPLVAGQGVARLRAEGIRVDVGLHADEARELNIGFFSRMLRRRPWVRVKAAMSLDGRTALPDGTSQWITGPEARADGHAWRKRAGAVLTGAGTVVHDNPRLDVRLVETARQPLRVLIDSGLRCQIEAKLFEPPGPVLVYCSEAGARRASRLAHPHVEVVVQQGNPHRVDLGAVLADLHLRQVNELHVEAGATLNGSLVRLGLVDEWLVYCAPLLLGEGRGLVADAMAGSLSEAHGHLRFVSCDPVGADLRLRLRTTASLPAFSHGQPGSSAPTHAGAGER